MDTNTKGLDLDASCCMEIAGIESMIEGVDAPVVRDMIGKDTTYEINQNPVSSTNI